MKIIIFLLFFNIIKPTFATKITIEENGRKKVINIPSDHKQNVILNIDSNNKSSLSFPPDVNDTTIKNNKPPQEKTVKVVNVYHYFYPCSANPDMANCIKDDDIKIDNKTNRLVIINEQGEQSVDVLDQKTKIITETAFRNGEKTSNSFDTRQNNNNQQISQNIPSETQALEPATVLSTVKTSNMFGGPVYPRKTLPTNDQTARITPSFSNPINVAPEQPKLAVEQAK